MKFKHSLVYTSLFMLPVAAMAENTSLSQVTVSESASDAQDINNGSYQSRVSNIANKGATPLIDSPQTVNVVNNQLLEDRKPTSIDEALATVSGTTQANT